MTPEDQTLADAFGPVLKAAQVQSIQHIDRSLNCSGHQADDFATVVLTLHRKTGILSIGADMSREDTLRLLADAATQTMLDMHAEAQRKALEN